MEDGEPGLKKSWHLGVAVAGYAPGGAVNFCAAAGISFRAPGEIIFFCGRKGFRGSESTAFPGRCLLFYFAMFI